MIHALTVFTGTWFEAVSFLLLGILFSGIVAVFVPDGALQRFFPKNTFLGICFGIIGGFFFPVCDCASVPVFRSLIRKGIPFPGAVAFLTAAPIINPVVMVSTWYAFGGNFRIVLARTLLGVLSSAFIALSFIKKDPERYMANEKTSVSCSCGEEAHGTFFEKCAAVVSYTREEFLEAGSWQTIGILIATLFQVVVNGATFFSGTTHFFSTESGLVLSVLLMMVFAYCLSLCSTSDAVICSVIGKGFPVAAQLAFLVFGPMMDIKNTMLLGGMCSVRLSARMFITTFIVCFSVISLFAFCGGSHLL